MIIHFIDTETTGLDPLLGAEIIEIACATWNDGDVSEEWHKLILPARGCPEEAAKINGYSEADWRANGAQPFSIQDAKYLIDRFEGHYIGGSNPDFDKRMIEASCHRCGQPKPKWSHSSLNTASLAWPLWAEGKVEQTGLVALAAFFGIEHAAHTAMGDVLATIAVWEALFDLYIYKPRVMREALIEIAGDDQTDAALRDFALAASKGEQ